MLASRVERLRKGRRMIRIRTLRTSHGPLGRVAARTFEFGVLASLAGCSGDGETRDAAASAMPLFAHPGGCNQCHVVGGIWALKTPLFQLCSTADCHESLIQPSDRPHGPFAIQDCTICHRFHSSENRHILVRAQPALCAHCHEKLITCPAGAPDFAFSDPPCTSCHGGHGGEGRFLIRAGAKEKFGLTIREPLDIR